MSLGLHLIFLLLFLALFAIMAIFGSVRLIKEGRIASSIFVLVCACIFGVSTYLAATL